MSEKLDFYYSAVAHHREDAPVYHKFKGSVFTECTDHLGGPVSNIPDAVLLGTGTYDDIDFNPDRNMDAVSICNYRPGPDLVPIVKDNKITHMPAFDLRKHFNPIINNKQPEHVLDTDFVIVQFYCEERDKTSFVGGIASEADWSLGKTYAVVMVAV